MISILAPSRERPEPCQIPYRHDQISILAPSRERLVKLEHTLLTCTFQSSLPHGSDGKQLQTQYPFVKFQSSLPHGSDSRLAYCQWFFSYFNPRSLTGATGGELDIKPADTISILAPSRERLWIAIGKA